MFRNLWRLFSNDRGSVTVEAALALSSLVIVIALIIGVLTTLASYIAATNAAGAAARAYAIGESFEPRIGKVEISENAGLITVTISIPAIFGKVSADAVFPIENK